MFVVSVDVVAHLDEIIHARLCVLSMLFHFYWCTINVYGTYDVVFPLLLLCG
eukprot:m.557 g.557  ORF g.557 m.557 type:complete len:52 (+) comp513_c0_seq1:219-374(+)